MNFLKEYESPIFEVFEISHEDVITTSPFGEDKDNDQGEWDNMTGGDNW